MEGFLVFRFTLDALKNWVEWPNSMNVEYPVEPSKCKLYACRILDAEGLADNKKVRTNQEVFVFFRLFPQLHSTSTRVCFLQFIILHSSRHQIIPYRAHSLNLGRKQRTVFFSALLTHKCTTVRIRNNSLTSFPKFYIE